MRLCNITSLEDWMSIKIGRNAANQITVSFPYNPYNIAKIKTKDVYTHCGYEQVKRNCFADMLKQNML